MKYAISPRGASRAWKTWPAGTAEAFGDDLEVMDEGLHLGLHLLAVGEDDLGGVGDDAALGEAVEGLRQILRDSRISCMRTM